MPTRDVPKLLTIEAYNRGINIAAPRLPHFDIRDFTENMKTVRLNMSPFRIGFFQIAILESGGGTVTSDAVPFDLDNCTVFFNLPGHVIHWEVPADWRGYYICIDESFYTVALRAYPRLFDFPFFRAHSPGIHLNPLEANIMLELMRRMYQEYNNLDELSTSILQAEVATTLSYCLKFYIRQGEERMARIEGVAKLFQQVVHDRITALLLGDRAELSVRQCAEALFISPQYLSEVIRRELDTTPTAYINNCLIREACKMLRSTEMTAAEVAARLGYSSAAYFSRVFKKIMRKSPNKWRAEQ